MYYYPTKRQGNWLSGKHCLYTTGCKSYSKTKPMRIEEFEPEKAWWEKREENEQAWKVNVEQIKASGYNLDIKNHHVGETESHDPDELLVKYRKLQAEVDATREALKRELMVCLGKRK